MVVLVLVVVSVAAAAAWSTGRLNHLVCGGPCGPEAVADPLALTRSDGLASTAQLEPAAGSVDADAVREAVSGALEDDDLGSRVGLSVMDPAAGEEVLRTGPATLVPASTTKVLTAAAALETIDPQQRFSTRVEREGQDVVLVGGGDPYLVTRRDDDSGYAARADLRTLAESTAEALAEAGVEQVRVGYDDSLFTGPAASSTWEDSYVPGQVVTPISALWTERGISNGVRTSEPARAAASTFATLLGRQGIDVDDDVDALDAPGTEPIAEAAGPTVAQAVESLLLSSNNEATEVIARHVAIARGEEASFEGGARAVADALREADVPLDGLELGDGSGLSRENRIDPTTLATIVSRAISGDAWPGVLSGLPVGAFSGSLAERFDGEASDGAGLVRAKTGTLTGVHSLAGYVTDARGVPLAFAVMVDDTRDLNALATQAALDDVAAALAACTCG